ncbi:MAG: HAMP domain-containing protein, partial [Candidatus Omnitrophica bacterium]|nr:HAMP domain-containing protein [Candidatus Omnitrophota bacterium]
MTFNLFRIRESLKAKLLTIIIIVVCFLSSLFIFSGMWKTHGAIRDQSEEYGRSLAQGIASACTDLLQEGNFMALEKSLFTIGRAYKTIRDIKIYVENICLARYTLRDGNDKDSTSSIATETFTAPITHQSEGQTIGIGVVQVTYSVERYFTFFMQQMQKYFLYGFVLLIGIVLLLIFFLNRLIVKPLEIIDKGAAIIGAGNLDHQITVKNKDEIGRLSHSFNDMTRKFKKAKEEIEEWNRTLEVKVDERTKELEEANVKLNETQYQLIQSGKMAAIGMVGAEVAHELKNPLSFILGYAQLMRKRIQNDNYDKEKFEKNFASIEKETKRCAGIIADIAHFAKRSTMTFEPVDVREVADSTFAVMKYQLRRWKIETHTDFPQLAATVHGNKDKLQQVFINLIANAHNAMPDGGAITIGVVVKEKRVEISFQDTGCGIPKEDLE